MSDGMKQVIGASHLGLLAVALTGVAVIWQPAPLIAQEVVQAVPPREAAQLSAALRRLASRPGDLEALITAGNASLVMRDLGAAAGFFTRAANVAPGDRRVHLGSARVALEQRRPVAALEGFAKAESAGIRALEMAADRALAYDLVGDNAKAQALYRSALAAREDSELRRRLALSLAISGNRSEFERVLYPMLRDEDRAAYRTRAFGLAVLGRPDEAVAIADAMMPTDLALRMAPYLRYMPRLTKAQQAAAANLGAFPAAAEIGRDSAEIAGYASAGARIAANASTLLTPTGPALGTRAQPAPVAAPLLRPSAAAIATALPPGPPPIATTPTTRLVSAPAPSPVVVATAPRNLSPAPLVSSAPAVVVAQVSPAPAVAPTLSSERISLSEAFADLEQAPTRALEPAAGAVNIAALGPARRPASETPAKTVVAVATKPSTVKPKSKVEAPAEPSRFWAQVGVGRNTGAFAFDWRRLAKEAGGVLDGKGPWAVKYGATNRMLAGPYPTDADVKAAVKRLKDKGIEALPFTSDAGEKVSKIG